MHRRCLGAGEPWWLRIPESLLALLVPVVAASLIPKVRLHASLSRRQGPLSLR